MPATRFPVDSTHRRHVPFIEHTKAFWQVRTRRPVTSEDARRIARHAAGFFRLLHEWAEREAHESGEAGRHSETTRDH